MCRQEILAKMKTSRLEILRHTKLLGELQEELDKCSEDEWDWIPIKDGAEMLKCSVQTLYKKVRDGQINVRYIGAKMLVKKSELKQIDDKYEVNK